MADQNADSMRSQRTKLPPRCVHCKAREPLDADGFCLDYHACVQRQPLGARRRGTAQIDSSGGGVVSQNADSVSANIHKATPAKVFADDAESTCIHCHKGIRKVPGGHGPTWVHSDSGAVVGSGSEQIDRSEGDNG